MAIRKDGLDTQDKLLKAASAVFADKGYQNTTVAEISRCAECNVASVNYHFGSKDALYIAVWKNAFAEAMQMYPPDGGLTAEAPPDEKLRALVYSHLHRILDDGRLGYAGKILLQEMAQPTEVIHMVRHEVIGHIREHTRSIIKELLGPEGSDQDINFCEMSVIHQCLAIGFRKGRLPPHMAPKKLTAEFIDALVNHITRFCLAGIASVRESIESRNS